MSPMFTTAALVNTAAAGRPNVLPYVSTSTSGIAGLLVLHLRIYFKDHRVINERRRRFTVQTANTVPTGRCFCLVYIASVDLGDAYLH